MVDTSDDFAPSTKPMFMDKTKVIHESLKALDVSQLKSLLKCNDDLVSLNYQRNQNNQLDQAIYTALMSYHGLQYQQIGADLMSQQEMDYLQDHLRILSGFYGVLRPLDAIVPYRLEMQAKLSIDEHQHLYSYWHQEINEYFKDEMIINLASKEYSDALALCKENMLTIDFKVKNKDKYVTKATLAKMARGAMVRYLAMNQVEEIESIKLFNDFDFVYNEALSSNNHWIFVQQK